MAKSSVKIAETTSPVFVFATLSTFSLSPDLVEVTRIVDLAALEGLRGAL
jgi:hypothetical protein